MSKGVLYLTWPDDKGELPNPKLINRSIASVRKHHPDLPVHHETLPRGSSLLDKSRMADITPFDLTLYLDIDTVVCGNLDFGFAMAALRDLACCVCECPWARRYAGLAEYGDLIEYNTGVIFFSRGANTFFDRWKVSAVETDSSILFRTPAGMRRMPINDQASFAVAAMVAAVNPLALPLNYNFRPKWQRSFFGPIKVWHDYAPPPPEVLAQSEAQSKPGAVIEYFRLRDPEPVPDLPL